MARNGEFRRTIEMLARGLSGATRIVLKNAPNSAFTTSDVAASLLGNDLWYPPLAKFRDRLIRTNERPHLWTFDFRSSALWDNSLWNRLSLLSRIVRSRAGGVQCDVRVHVSYRSLGVSRREFDDALKELGNAGLFARTAGTLWAIAPAACLDTDLALVGILSHWLSMLKHRESVLSDRDATGLEVHGHSEACSLCVARWGIRTFESSWAPPFHPGCRCFAQPRFAV